MTKGFDIELIFQLVNKKESLQQVNATKSDPNYQKIRYLAAFEKKSPLCSGRSTDSRRPRFVGWRRKGPQHAGGYFP
jgi:hypothetical protein